MIEESHSQTLTPAILRTGVVTRLQLVAHVVGASAWVGRARRRDVRRGAQPGAESLGRTRPYRPLARPFRVLQRTKFRHSRRPIAQLLACLRRPMARNIITCQDLWKFQFD
jgi:hypothetical protein